MNIRRIHPIVRLAAGAVIILIAGCSSQGTGSSPTGAVEAYLAGLIAKDENQVITMSCAAWEEQARQELRSFDANSIKLNNLECQEAGSEGETTLVHCTGEILATYGSENMTIDLSQQTYKVIQESGEWRMCGYK
jgi:hypothetical protein